MEKCEFKTAPPGLAHIYLQGTALNPLDAIAMKWDDKQWPCKATLEICELAEETGVWLFFRFGTFNTTGGGTWSRLMLEFDPSLTERFHDKNGDVILGDHILGAALEDGDLLDDPPIHQHHFHFYF